MGHRRALVALGIAACSLPTTEDGGRPDRSPELHARGIAIRDEVALPARGDFHATATGYATALRDHAVAIRDGRATVTPIANGASGDPIDFATVGTVRATTLVDGAVRIDRGWARELWRERTAGVEQSWEVAAAPAGDFVVEVAVSGARLVATTSSGLHFAGAGGLGVRYSHATWIDATGATWSIPATFAGDRIRLAVPADVIAASKFPATLDPTVSAEVAVDAPVPATTGMNTSNAQVAFDGTNFLVVWADARAGTDTDIWGVRVAQDGTILDPTGIRIAATPGVQTNPTVAFVGTRYVVAWEDYKVSGGTEADIAAATVSTAGVVAAVPAPAISFSSETAPAIAARGNGALLAWTVNGQIVGAVFDGNFGNFGAQFAITSGTNVHKDAAVAANPAGDYLVAFTETTATTSDDIRGQLVSAPGALVGAAFNISAGAGPQVTAAASFDGTSYDVVWSTNNGGVDIFGTRVSTAGVALDTHLEGAVTVGGVAVNRAANNQDRPTIACTSAGCLVAWQDGRTQSTTGTDVYGQLLTTAFAPSGGDFVIATAPNGQNLPRVAVGGGGYFAVWQDLRNGTQSAQTITGARVTAAGAVVDANGIVLVRGVNQENSPTIAHSGGTIAVGWSDSRGDGADIEMVRLDGAGTVLDASAVAVSAATAAQSTPASVGFGGDVLYAWTDTRGGIDQDIYAARVNAASGTVTDANGLALTTATGNQTRPDAASSGTEALVVWMDRGAGSFDILGAIVDATGAVAVPPFVISNGAGDQNAPAVAYDAASGQYVVVWSEAAGILGARVTPTGSVLDPNGTVIATAAGSRTLPKIAATGGTLLAVFEDTRNGNRDIFGVRLTAGAALTVLDPGGIAIATDPAKQNTPTVASLGGSFFVAWNDQRALATTKGDIFAQVVDANGTLDGANFAVSANAEDETAPVATEVSPSRVVIAYRKLRTDIDANRVVTRAVEALSISVLPANPTVLRGETQQFTAIATAPDGSQTDVTTQVTWSSSATGVATIDAQGLATAVAVGSSTITATLGTATGSTTLTVDPPQLLSIAVTPPSASAPVGTAVQFAATGTFSDGSTQDVTATATWASSNTGVATVGATGLAAAVGQGSTTISATLGGVSGSATLVVTAAALASINVTPALPTIAKGTQLPFTATGVFTDGSTQDITTQVTWSSSPAAVATITAGGVATAVNAGTATIRAQQGTVSGSTTLTVTAAVAVALEVQPVDATIAQATQLAYTAIATFSDGTTQDVTAQVTWTSTLTGVATITASGVATGVAAGTTTIRATRGTLTATTSLTVTASPLVSIAVTPANQSIAIGTTLQYSATGTFADGSQQDVSSQVAWSSATTAAAITATGLATGTNVGTTSIRATFGAIVGSTSLTVTNATLVSIAVTPATARLARGFKLQYHATGTFSDGTTQDLTTLVTWSSSNTAVASISNAGGSRGLATAVGVGTTTIRATRNGIVGTATLTGTNAALTSIAVTPNPLTLVRKQKRQLTAIGTFNDGSTLDITNQVSWRSAKPNTVSVNKSGVANGNHQGSTTISASKNGVTATIAAQVN